MQDFKEKKILLGVCGSIAVYKSAYLVRELTKLGALVRVVMTHSALQLMTPMIMQALSGFEVRTELFDSEAERAMGHIELARWADYVVIAPASANCLAKLAHGLADDLLTTLYLVTNAPVLICPAMNQSMWTHPATRANCGILMQRGVMMVGPEDGSQACGEMGFGRMSETEHIITALRLVNINQQLLGRKVLITAGPTREAIDPIRYISNHSSGRMGYALATAAQMAGADVTLISGPTILKSPPGIKLEQVNSAVEMFDSVMSHLQLGMIFIGAAAVADYSVPSPMAQKIKKTAGTSLDLSLKISPDILASVVKSRKPLYTVGFAAETNDVLKHAREKLRGKKVDMLVANQVGNGRGFDAEENEVTVLTAQHDIVLTSDHKTRIAGQIIAIIAANLQNAIQ